jgi:hypothetical protein
MDSTGGGLAPQDSGKKKPGSMLLSGFRHD